MKNLPKTKEEWKQLRLNFWKNYQRENNFEIPDDVPGLPVWDKEEMEKYVWPKLIQYGAIPIENLIVGHTYLGECRNASKAIWKENNKFEYVRHKFGLAYLEEINHFQDDDGYDVFVPIKDLGMI